LTTANKIIIIIIIIIKVNIIIERLSAAHALTLKCKAL
jgi:hypothetical protein